jgi:hypothetical protein
MESIEATRESTNTKLEYGRGTGGTEREANDKTTAKRQRVISRAG